ncbi:MAG: ATP-binding protein [Actinomycetota bacterium]
MPVSDPSTVVDLEFRPEPSVVQTARDATNVVAAFISPSKLDDLRLLTSELVTNSVKHAGLTSDDWVRLKLILRDGRVHVEVRDPGAGFVVPDAPRPGGVSGWGLYFLDRIADRWGMTHDRDTCAWFELDVA